MAWSDIDFSKIVTGAITRGPAEFSFSDYLNKFSTALRERENITILGFNPTPSNIVFESGEIRNSTFWQKFRDLINGYRDLWHDYDYYTSGVMTDTLNSNNYLITDTDLETAIGSEAWNILNNADTLAAYEIFTASILNAFYIIYQKTQYIRRGRGSIDGGIDGDDVYYNIPMTYTYITRTTQYVSVIDTQSSTFSGSRSLALSEMKEQQGQIGNTFLAHFYNEPRIRGDYNGGTWTWTHSGNWQDLYLYSLACKDLQGNLLNMDYVMGRCVVYNNFVRDDSTGTTEYTSYINDYPYSDTGFNPAVPIYAETIIHEYEQVANYGSRQYSYFIGNRGTDQVIFPSMSNTSNSGTQDKNVLGQFWVGVPNEGFINLNNSALEYYIAP